MSIALWARYTPDAPAIISPVRQSQFFRVERQRQSTGPRTASGRAPRGDSVAVVASNRPEFAEIVFACTRSGLRYTPVNRYLSADEIAYIVNDCQAGP